MGFFKDKPQQSEQSASGLGLQQLTDDQLLELVQETCQELASRDPYVRNLAQQTISTEAEKISLRRRFAQEAVKLALHDYVATVRVEVLQDVQRLVADGSIRLFTPEEEAQLAVKAEEEAVHELQQEELARRFRATNPAVANFNPPPLYPAGPPKAANPASNPGYQKSSPISEGLLKNAQRRRPA